MIFPANVPNYYSARKSADSSDSPIDPAESLPDRSQTALKDRWQLTRIFPSDAAWEKAFTAWTDRIARFNDFPGRLADEAVLRELLEFDSDFDRAAERLGAYAYLRSVEDLTDAKRQSRKDRFSLACNRAAEAASFIRPELLALPDSAWKKILAAPAFARWHRKLAEIYRFKPHTLSAAEERVISMTGEMRRTASNTFRLLTDADMNFGTVENEQKRKCPLTSETFSVFLHSPKRSVRRKAFEKFYAAFDAHKNTLAATLDGSIRNDVFSARIRNYPDSLSASLFAENITPVVYENLIETVHEALPSLYRYYDIRRRAMRLKEIHFYDTYVPILCDDDFETSWEDAVELIGEALAPLGKDYVQTLKKGLTAGRWADRYQNKGKQSGAFSMPGYDFPPFIMTNFKTSLLESIFTLAHEAGHSMHSLLSARKQPFETYDYEIFLAEIASTFNEQMLSAHLFDQAANRRIRAQLLNREIDAFRATLFRQTMFSEFERDAHAAAERGKSLNISTFRAIYRNLLDLYFGPDFIIDDVLELECLRIPHFYRAFYVYKYATGIAAAAALSERVRTGGEQERLDYFQLLEGGCSAPPLEILRRAGVDLEKPAPLRAALKRFDSLVAELESLLFDADEPLA